MPSSSPSRRSTRRAATPRCQGAGESLAGDAAAALDRAAIAVSAELVGICQRALEMGVAYVKDRKQFETPVGAYQAVSHRCAQMLRDTESARSTTYYAGWAADAEPGAARRGGGARQGGGVGGRARGDGSNIQVHGGIGFTWEADAHWLFKRAQMDSALLGGAGTHRARAGADRRRAPGVSPDLAASDASRVAFVREARACHRGAGRCPGQPRAGRAGGGVHRARAVRAPAAVGHARGRGRLDPARLGACAELPRRLPDRLPAAGLGASGTSSSASR